MLRLALFIFVAGFIWFTVKDAPGMTIASVDTVASSSPARPTAAAPEQIILAQAQTRPSAKARPTRKARAATRIEVYPLRNMVRRCVDWYAEERRPSGTVIVPHMRCRWVRR